jgi:hypothetical protein
MGVGAASNISAFRAFRTQIRNAFAHYDDSYVLLDVLLTWGTTRFSAITVPHKPRRYGVSNYTLTKLVRQALNLITGFSVLPLQVASILGLVSTLFGVLVFGYAVINYVTQGSNSVPGFTFLASVVAIFSGVQLFSLGIIGEYLARMHYRMMRKPSYTVREKSGARVVE